MLLNFVVLFLRLFSSTLFVHKNNSSFPLQKIIIHHHRLFCVSPLCGVDVKERRATHPGESETKATTTFTTFTTTTMATTTPQNVLVAKASYFFYLASSSSHRRRKSRKSRSCSLEAMKGPLRRQKNCCCLRAPQRPRTSSTSTSCSTGDATWNESDEPDVVIVRSKKSGKKILFSTRRRLDVKEISRLCDKVGWPKRPEEKLKIAFENSYLVAQMYICNDSDDKKNEEERLIATCRATSDHAFNACLWDIIVDPEYQGQGLGKAIVSHSIRALLARDVANVTLFADRDVVKFYERLGFVTDADGVKAMFLYPNGEDGEEE